VEFREQRLENGLEIIAECNPNAYSTALGFFVRAGSRDETDEIAGVSHFLEHMAFKGTPKRSAADVNRELDEMGSSSNAHTSEERTVYHAIVLPDFQDRAVELLSDIMRPSLRHEDFEMEKQVIIEEISMYEDQPPFNAPEKCMAVYFGSHSLSRSILGTVESVGAMTPEQMRTYFQQRYSPSNIMLVATGNVDFDRLVEVAGEHCGGWEQFDATRETLRAEPRTAFEVIHKETAAQQYVIQISAGPAAAEDDRYAARLLATILGDGSGSRMYWELVDPGLAEYAVMEPYEFQGTGIFFTYLCCAPEDTADNLQRIHDIYRTAERDGITEEELTRAKNKIRAHVVLGSERSSARLFPVGVGWLQRRRYQTVRDILDSYAAVTMDDVTAILKKYPPTISSSLAIGPLKKLDAPS